MSDIRFTKTVLEKLPVAAHGQRDNYCDTATPGLMVRVTHTGAKTFYVRRRINGVPERIRLGAFPQMTIEQARAKAAQVNGAIAEKRNPAEARRAARAEPLYGETFERFLKDKRNRSGKPLSARTTEGYRKVTETYLSSFKTRKLSEITPELVKRTLS
jgi:hypothetical protein